jgi:acetyl-CoA carboxylase biotin carboxyl carrier protein
LIALASETGIAELEVQRGDNRVRIRRAIFSSPQEIVVSQSPVMTAAPGGGALAPAATVHAVIPAVETHKDKEPQKGDPSLILVKSPIVGTFYESPSPDSPPFVRVGERVQPGKVLCIIESMKLMNEIEAETSGVIESKLVLNGQPVEYGEALFAVRAV